MCKKIICLAIFSLAAGLFLSNTASAIDPSLVCWWKLDETSGTVVADSSGNGYDAELPNGGTWVPDGGVWGGALQLAGGSGSGENEYVNIPSIGSLVPTLGECTISLWGNVSSYVQWARYVSIGNSTASRIFITPSQTSSNSRRIYADVQGGTVRSGQRRYSVGEWHHVALTMSVSQQQVRLYVNGNLEGTTDLTGWLGMPGLGVTANNWLGRSEYTADGYLNGLMDDVRIYDRVLSGDEIMDAMNNIDPAASARPNPGNGAEDVIRDGVVLTWRPGEGAVTHNLFIGTDYNDVNDATIANPLSTTAASLDVNSYALPRLDFGTTYYWRVDEVSATGTYPGRIWSFTSEALALTLNGNNITATASTPAYGDEQDPNSTCDGAGLSNGMHSTDRADMWLAMGAGVPGDSWIQYEFDKAYLLHNMLVWNYNEAIIGPDFGAKDVNIVYSPDGETWTDLGSVITFNKATGEDTYTANTTVNLDGIVAKYVKIIFDSTWSTMGMPFYGLSEVQFSYIPVWAREPDPSEGASNVAVDATLTWRPGREAAEHTVYLSTDGEAVTDGTADAVTVSDASDGPLSLVLQSTYYWRVDEANSAEPNPLWEGDVWSFTTADSIIVDNFEDYNDTSPFTVYNTWKDGLAVPAYGGSQMGHFNAPFAETTYRHGGLQSGPFYYDNTTQTKSEVVANTADLMNGSDWSLGSPNVLVIWFRGQMDNADTDQIYVKIGSTKVVYGGSPSDISRTAWTKFEVPLDGINLANVSSLTVGVERIGATGGSGLLYLDDIQLTIDNVVAVDPGTDNLIARYNMENNVLDSSGHNLNGTANGDPAYAAGKAGKGMAMVFDGTNDYVDLPIGPTISTLTDCTISVWVNWSGQGGIWQRVYDFGNGPPTNMWLCPSTGTNMRFVLKPNDALGEFPANTSSIEASNWQNVVAVIKAGDPNTISLYLNGDLVATNNNLRALPMDMGETPQNWIGRSQYSADPFFNGMVDDLRIYDRALTAGEVRYLYEN